MVKNARSKQVLCIFEPRLSKHMDRIYLIGAPYAGKSTVGKWLAERLEWQFIDLDDFIEEYYNISIPAIFAEFGESRFREMETACLQIVSKRKQVVVSCGGGTCEKSENIQCILSTGFSIHLNTEKQILMERMQQDDRIRPLFAGKTLVEKQQILSDLVEKRAENFSKAKLIWNGNPIGEHFQHTVNQLLTLYSQGFMLAN